MKRFIVTVSLVFAVFSFCIGQSSSNSILIFRKPGGYVYCKGDSTLNTNYIACIVEPNVQAYKEIKHAKNLRAWSFLTGGVGGFMIGWQLGNYLSGAEVKPIPAAIGAFLTMVSIPLRRSSRRYVYKAIKTYNSGLNKPSSFNDNPKLNIGINTNGAGMNLRF